MKIGYVQLEPVLGDRDANIAKIERQRPAFDGADLLVLPELCSSGYNFISLEQARALSEPAEDGPFTKYLEQVCREHGLHLVAGLNERWGEDLYNTAVLVGPGGYIGKYRKMHLFWDEWDRFLPGDTGLPVFDIGACRLGILICFDWIFPETWRVLALEGADLVCHPSNLVLPGLCQQAVPVQSIMNRIYIVTANRTGIEGDLTFTGASIISSPKGEVLARAGAQGEEVSVVEADMALARDKAVTPRNDVLGDRRPEEYRPLVGPARGKSP